MTSLQVAFASPVLLPASAAAVESTCAADRRTVTPTCLNKRSEAARRRWQDPEYRAKMAAARARNHLRRAGSGLREEADARSLCHGGPPGVQGGLLEQEGVIELGVGDSITLCDDAKAAAINNYAIRNQLRSEKLRMFHQEPQRWMDSKLQQGEDFRTLIMSDDMKRQRQLARQEQARQRHARIRARKEAEAASAK